MGDETTPDPAPLPRGMGIAGRARRHVYLLATIAILIAAVG